VEVTEKLSIAFAGVKMRSPLGVGTMFFPMGQPSAVTAEVHAETLLKHVEAGAGYVEVATSGYMSKEMASQLKRRAQPREFAPASSAVRWMRIGGEQGLYFFDTNVAFPVEDSSGFDHRRKIIDILKRRLPEKVALIASISPVGDFSEAAVLTAKKVEEIGVDLIELNLSCGMMSGTKGALEQYLERRYPLIVPGELQGGHIDLAEKMATAVVNAVDTPVGVKVTPEFGMLQVAGLARCLRDAGVKYVQISNMAPVIAPPDIYNRGKSQWPHVDGNPFVAVSGAYNRMGCYKNVAGVAKFAPGIEIAASGGLVKPSHAVEVMMLGAKLAQFCGGLFFRGRKLLMDTTRFLERFLEEQGYENVEELVGLGVQHIKPVEELYVETMVAEVDQAKCTGCGICTDHICIAMEMDGEEGKAKPNADLCLGCGLCVATCPTQAIRLVPRE